MVADFRLIRIKHSFQQLIVPVAACTPCCGVYRLPVTKFKPVEVFIEVHRKHRRGFHGFQQVRQLRFTHIDTGKHCARNRFALGLPLLHAPLLDKLLKAETFEERVEGVGIVVIPAVFRGVKVHGDFLQNRRQPVGHAGALFPGGELLAHALLDIQSAQIGVDVFHGAVFANKLQRGLLANAGHARDVVGAVAHEGLEVHHLRRIKAVFLAENLRRIVDGLRASHAGLDVADGGGIGDELETVLVPGDDHAVPAFFRAFDRDGTQDIVRLVARHLIAADAHGVERLLQNRHLGRELLWHALALGLVAVVGLVAEGGLTPVEAHAHGVGLLLVEHALEDVQKAKDSVGGRAVGRV